MPLKTCLYLLSLLQVPRLSLWAWIPIRMCSRRRRPGRSGQTPRHSERAHEPGGLQRELVDWARGFGPLERAGVEGTGSFGCGLARFLQAEGIEVFEVIRLRRRDQYPAAANPTPSTPKRRHARYWQAPRLAGPKAPTARSR